jgi:hypothetical protein
MNDQIITVAKALGYTSPYLTSGEAAKFLKKSIEWMQLQRTNGVGPSFIRLGDAKNSPILYSLIELVSYVEANLIKTS